MTTSIGTSSVDSLTGGSGNDVLVGKSGDDILDGGAGADILLGGAGNDLIYYDQFDLRVDGGTGYDTLVFNGTNQTLNLGLQKTVMNFERIDLAGGGGHTLTFSAADVLRTSDLDSLMIHGTQSSQVNFSDSGWTFQGYGSGLSKFVNGTAIVYIDNAVNLAGFSGNATLALAAGSASSVTEDLNPDALGKLVASGSITVTDPNVGQGVLTDQVQAVGTTIGMLTLVPGALPGTSNGSYQYTISNSAVQYLGGSQDLTESFIVKSIDGSMTTLSFVTHGINDPAQIGAPNHPQLTEDLNPDLSGNLVATGSIPISDADQGQASFDLQNFNGQGIYGTLALASDGQYTYTVSNASIQGLMSTDLRSDFFHVKSLDGTTTQIEFQVAGADDPALIGSPTVASVKEDVSVNGAGMIVATGTIPITDPDANQNQFDLQGFNGQGQWGVLALDASGSYTYTVDNASLNTWNSNRTETDTFTVTSADGSQAQVSFQVHGTNDAPTIVGGTFAASFTEDPASLNADGSLPFALYNTGGNFTFTDIDNVLSGGFSVNVQGLNGAFGVTAAPIIFFDAVTPPNVIWTVVMNDSDLNNLKSGQDLTLTYRITLTDPSGGQTTQDATVLIHGADDPIMGDANGNTLTGTTGNDLMSGLGGDDTISGLAGNDTIYGGDGNDTITGGAGTNHLIGGAGNDTYILDIAGGLEASTIDEGVGGGTDTLKVNASFSLASYANIENLFADGTSSNLTLTGNAQNNILQGGSGSDTLNGSDGNDQFYTGGGDDTINGGNGNDTLFGSGNQLLTFFGGAGNDTVDLSNVDSYTEAMITGGAGADRYILPPTNGDAYLMISDFDIDASDGIVDTIDVPFALSQVIVQVRSVDTYFIGLNFFGGFYDLGYFSLSDGSHPSLNAAQLISLGCIT